MAESKEELKSLLKVKEESEKAGLKLNIQKPKIMASGPITSWQTDGETMGSVRNFVWIWELDYKESWEQKNWCFWNVVLQKTLESPLDSRIKLVNPKLINFEYSLEGLMLKLKLQYPWPPDAKRWLIEKDLDAEKD